MFVPNKLVKINNTVDKAVSLPDTVDKTYIWTMKITGATTGAAGLAKGSMDFVEAVACQDGICATISAVGVIADTLQVCTSFVPGPNVTCVVTTPVSVGCKVFVWCCKRAKLP